ncbi:uncharacterized protein L969DRAFT_92490 [Mixia osmundae IAM 14324]|uniref:Uncharacterized protein n=1 Tax=Mixia osmundae (strain CBS 9802 / IAM 14324 / JCM 22182 / KY 12970) TaxID=764103 RepID=G7DXE0_MIXOS|nr:uncharacterized protein L969DRAFT_92490 [Mixia osmundae IAM 14324]KEI41256.1 hypothetical protein L969DRAFT_92490 [Mixia osmundae IAM 14324]GAA95250.1 hypothetical protein E5Q_01906 [Mixia osmundae IAM 14324]
MAGSPITRRASCDQSCSVQEGAHAHRALRSRQSSGKMSKMTSLPNGRKYRPTSMSSAELGHPLSSKQAFQPAISAVPEVSRQSSSTGRRRAWAGRLAVVGCCGFLLLSAGRTLLSRRMNMLPDIEQNVIARVAGFHSNPHHMLRVDDLLRPVHNTHTQTNALDLNAELGSTLDTNAEASESATHDALEDSSGTSVSWVAETSIQPLARALHGTSAIFFPGKWGFSNHVYIAMKAGYLGVRTNRSVILTDPYGPLSFSSIFDHQGASRLAGGMPSYDLHNVTEERVEVGCLTTGTDTDLDERNLHIQTWPMPEFGGYSGDSYEAVEQVSLMPVALESFISNATELHSRYTTRVRPQADVLCVYPAFGLHEQEYESIYGHKFDGEIMMLTDPAWQDWGRYLFFSAEIERLADLVIESVLSTVSARFVSVHIRRGDFCRPRFHRANCDMPHSQSLDLYAKALNEFSNAEACDAMQAVTDVLLLTDERDPDFSAEARKRGWHTVDTLSVVDRYLLPEWRSKGASPSFIAGIVAGAVMARSQAFVGTARSSMSALARLRVETWQGGCTALVVPN